MRKIQKHEYDSPSIIGLLSLIKEELRECYKKGLYVDVTSLGFLLAQNWPEYFLFLRKRGTEVGKSRVMNLLMRRLVCKLLMVATLQEIFPGDIRSAACKRKRGNVKRWGEVKERTNWLAYLIKERKAASALMEVM